MRFEITRTSFSSSDKPCNEAIRGEREKWDTRTCSEESFNSKEHLTRHNGKWREYGTRHKVLEGGYITRFLGMEPCWMIEVKSLKDLVNLSKKYGELIIDENSIEIYDDYRE